MIEINNKYWHEVKNQMSLVTELICPYCSKTFKIIRSTDRIKRKEIFKKEDQGVITGTTYKQIFDHLCAHYIVQGWFFIQNEELLREFSLFSNKNPFSRVDFLPCGVKPSGEMRTDDYIHDISQYGGKLRNYNYLKPCLIKTEFPELKEEGDIYEGSKKIFMMSPKLLEILSDEIQELYKNKQGRYPNWVTVETIKTWEEEGRTPNKLIRKMEEIYESPRQITLDNFFGISENEKLKNKISKQNEKIKKMKEKINKIEKSETQKRQRTISYNKDDKKWVREVKKIHGKRDIIFGWVAGAQTAHILERRRNDKERINPKNGIMLQKFMHDPWDQGKIRLTPVGNGEIKVIISEELKKEMEKNNESEERKEHWERAEKKYIRIYDDETYELLKKRDELIIKKGKCVYNDDRME